MKKGFFKALVATAVVGATIAVSGVVAMASETLDSWKADDLADANPTGTTDMTLGTQITYTPLLNKGASKSKVTGNNKTFADGATFTKRLQVGGASSFDKGGYFTITAPSAGTLSVYAVTGSNTDARTVEFYDANQTKLSEGTSGPIDDAATYNYVAFNFTVESAGTYYVASTGAAVNYCGMTWVANGVVEQGSADNAAVVFDGTDYYAVGLISKADAEAASSVSINDAKGAVEGTSTDTVYTGVSINNTEYTVADLTGSANSDLYVYGVKVTDVNGYDAASLNTLSLK
jgi:hypothetical protein